MGTQPKDDVDYASRLSFRLRIIKREAHTNARAESVETERARVVLRPRVAFSPRLARSRRLNLQRFSSVSRISKHKKKKNFTCITHLCHHDDFKSAFGGRVSVKLV